MAVSDITNVHGRLSYWANVHPDSEVFVFIDKDGLRSALTSQQILEEAQRFARHLIELGIKRGDVICSLLKESPNGIIAFFGIILAGGVYFNGKLHLSDGSFLIHNLNKSKSPVLILSSNETDEYNSFFSKLLDHQDCHKVTSNTLPFVLNAVYTKENDDLGFKWTTKETPISKGDVFCVDGDADALIIATSGTTGMSKLVVHSQFAFVTLFDAMDLKSRFGSLNCYSLSWGPGLPCYYFTLGQKTVNLDQRNPPLLRDLIQFSYDAIIKEKCDNVGMVTDALIDLVKYLNSLKCLTEWPENLECTFSGRPLSQSFVDMVKPYFNTIHNVYGSSEVTIASCKTVSKHTQYEDFNTGMIYGGSEVIVKDEKNVLLPKGKSGIIYVKTKWMFKRYLGDEELTRASFDDNGYFNMGDLGYVNEYGELIVYGRTKEIIVRGDDYFHPIWIEQAIRTCPEVDKVIVVQVPDEKLGNEICACVVLVEGSKYDCNIVEKFCKERFLPLEHDRTTACPRYFITMEKIPVNRNGKPDRLASEKFAINFLKRGDLYRS